MQNNTLLNKKEKNLKLKKKSQRTCHRADRAAVSRAPRVGRNHHAADPSLGGISQEFSNRSGEQMQDFL